MRSWLAFGICHALMTVAGWYFVGAAAQGSADGTGIAPLWLDIVNTGLNLLLLPLVRFALSLDPLLGGFTLASMLAFLLVALLNSALVMAVAYFLWRLARPYAMRRDPR